MVGNIDCVIMAQRPKMRPYIDEMKNNIAQALDIAPDCVNVKATTEEGLGFTGKEEGIAAHAVCLLENMMDNYYVAADSDSENRCSGCSGCSK